MSPSNFWKFQTLATNQQTKWEANYGHMILTICDVQMIFQFKYLKHNKILKFFYAGVL